MTTNPLDDIITKSESYLSIFDRKKIKQLKKKMEFAPFRHNALELEKDILLICKAVAKRNEAFKNIDYLNPEEKKKVEQIIEELKKTETINRANELEASVYQIYHTCFCREADFELQPEAQKYIDMLSESQTEREAYILASIIQDLFRTAKFHNK